jgi:23S rRNA G2069 N7-methylase RlmK/C1962 C5-methylase RlmI
MINKKSCLLLAVFFICGLWTVDCGLSDTIYTKDGKELKGIIVEDYKDRIVFSTVDGQLTLMKSDVKELYFDISRRTVKR